jgi:hypothetical protein
MGTTAYFMAGNAALGARTPRENKNRVVVVILNDIVHILDN